MFRKGDIRKLWTLLLVQSCVLGYEQSWTQWTTRQHSMQQSLTGSCMLPPPSDLSFFLATLSPLYLSPLSSSRLLPIFISPSLPLPSIPSMAALYLHVYFPPPSPHHLIVHVFTPAASYFHPSLLPFPFSQQWPAHSFVHSPAT